MKTVSSVLSAGLIAAASLTAGAAEPKTLPFDSIMIVPDCQRDANPTDAIFRKSGVVLPYQSVVLDLSSYTVLTRTALLRCTVTVPQEGDYFLGIGADGWHISWIDGKVAVDLDQLGNLGYPVHLSDHFFPVRLTAGKHTLDIRYTRTARTPALLKAAIMPPSVRDRLVAERKNVPKPPRRNVLAQFRKKQAYMDARVRAGIEANRKGNLFLAVLDENNKPVPNARIKVKQLTHDFKYGANIFMLDEFSKKEQNDAYKKYFREAFNLATLPFYWKTLEPEPGKLRFAKDSPKIYRRPAPDLCLEFCESCGIEPKVHILNYPEQTPAWARGTIEWEKKCLKKRYEELAARYAGRIPMWEVTNETFQPHNRYDFPNLYKQPDLIEWSFREAERCFPANTLIINESQWHVWDTSRFFRDRSEYYMQIERALLKGCRIDMIGMQYHAFFSREVEQDQYWSYYDPERIYDVLDCYAKLGKPIQITEITIPAYSTDPEDEAVQAEIIRNLYSIWFSHPAMTGLIYWNLVDGFAGGAKQGDMSAGENYYHGGLIRYDFTPKPAYKVICDLFQKEWHTELECITDSSGDANFRGFYGKYLLEIEANGKKLTREVHLSKDFSPHLTIRLQQ